MKKSEYSINEIVEALKSPGLGWCYKDQEDDDSFYGGEVIEITNWKKQPNELEIQGRISGNNFQSSDGNIEATIEFSIEELEAVAVQCIDGSVVILRHPIFSSNGKRIEGYWFSKHQPQYPMPIANQLNETEAKEIFDLIKIKEKEGELEFTRGSSFSRIDKTIVGSSEYHHEKWLWPEGFAEHYVLEYKVRPSDDFLEFIGWK